MLLPTETFLQTYCLNEMDSKVISEAVVQGFKGFFIADAVSMPVHWYYVAENIKEDYNGWIKQYEKPHDAHPSSSPLTLPEPVSYETKDGAATLQLIGDVILKDKVDAYKTNSLKANHYHLGMSAGDITLNCHCALVLLKTLKSRNSSMTDEDVVKQFFSDYVTFMITPGSHNDTYAEGFHKAFFSDWVIAGRPSNKDDLYKFTTERFERLSSNPPKEHQPYISSFVIPTPIILENIHRSVEKVITLAAEIYKRTHPNNDLIPFVNSYIRVLHAVVRGASLKDEAEKAFIQHFGKDGKSILDKYDKLVKESPEALIAFQKMGKDLGLSCHVKGSLPILMFIVRHYHDDFEGGILCNANVGGDNNGRAPALGALLGAAVGVKHQQISSKWTDCLNVNSVLDQLLTK